jgi:hypothetical protein
MEPAHDLAMRASVVVAAWFALVATGAAAADPPADLRLPPGTHGNAQGELVSGRGLRETSDFLAAELRRRGIDAQQIGPYGVRGVELTRFVSRTDQTPWLAIHVLRQSGKTLIFFVPRGKSATAP